MKKSLMLLGLLAVPAFAAPPMVKAEKAPVPTPIAAPKEAADAQDGMKQMAAADAGTPAAAAAAAGDAAAAQNGAKKKPGAKAVSDPKTK